MIVYFSLVYEDFFFYSLLSSLSSSPPTPFSADGDLFLRQQGHACVFLGLFLSSLLLSPGLPRRSSSPFSWTNFGALFFPSQVGGLRGLSLIATLLLSLSFLPLLTGDRDVSSSV